MTPPRPWARLATDLQVGKAGCAWCMRSPAAAGTGPGLALASLDLVTAVVDRHRTPHWWLYLLRGLATAALVLALLVWPGETLGVVRLIAAALLLIWGAATIGEAYQSPIRDNLYRGQIDREVRRII